MRVLVVALGIGFLGCAADTPPTKVRVSAPGAVAAPVEATKQHDEGVLIPMCYTRTGSDALSSSPGTAIAVKRSRLPADRYRVALAATDRHLYMVGGVVGGFSPSPVPQENSRDVFVTELKRSGEVG